MVILIPKYRPVLALTLALILVAGHFVPVSQFSGTSLDDGFDGLCIGRTTITYNKKRILFGGYGSYVMLRSNTRKEPLVIQNGLVTNPTCGTPVTGKLYLW